jgi:hypothetical protein
MITKRIFASLFFDLAITKYVLIPVRSGLFFRVIVGSRYLKIKNSKNCSSSILLVLGDLKNCLGLGLRPKMPKRGGYEVGERVRRYD